MERWQHHRFKDPSLTKFQVWGEHNRRKRILEREVVERTGIGYDTNRLVIGWARRISAYKRLNLLFSDIKRLEKIVKQSDREVQILIAGKAHPGDQVAKEHIQEVINYMKKELFGHAIYVHNYDLDLAFKLISGCDIWLNTPEYGQEASGTSGMKAASNGVLNFTVTDGWAAEVDWSNKGWTIDKDDSANCIYTKLETEIIPKYYNRSNEGLPEDWINMMKESIQMSRQYSTTRMLKQYQEELYT
jgi:alpha-glucan phosphorylase-like protein